MASLDAVPADAVRVMADDLREMTAAIFRKLDLPDADAELIAGCLVQVDLRGVVSHGTRRLRRYVSEYRNGGLNTHPVVRTVREEPVTALVDGDGGIGYLAAIRATRILIDKAAASGIAAVSTRNHGHVGSEGIYARMALEHDLATFSVAGGTGWEAPTGPQATVWDAMRSPPMCFGIPVAEGPPLVLDMSANMFRNREKLDQALRQFPEPVFKSLGLKFVSTLLGGILAGTVPPEERGRVYPAACRGFFIVAFRLDPFGDAEGFKREITRIIAESRALVPMPGQRTAEVAGSREWHRERTWVEEGIPIGREHRLLLEEIAGSLKVEVPW